MQISVGLSAAFVLAALFALRPKRLHPLELAFGGLLSVFCYLVYFLVVSVNWGMFEIGGSPDLFTVYLLFRFVISPVIVLSCLQLVHTARSPAWKLLIFLAFAGVLSALTSMCCAGGVLHYKKWSPVFIYGSWLVHLGFVGLGSFWFRWLLRKEVKLP